MLQRKTGAQRGAVYFGCAEALHEGAVGSTMEESGRGKSETIGCLAV